MDGAIFSSSIHKALFNMFKVCSVLKDGEDFKYCGVLKSVSKILSISSCSMYVFTFLYTNIRNLQISCGVSQIANRRIDQTQNKGKLGKLDGVVLLIADPPPLKLHQ